MVNKLKRIAHVKYCLPGITVKIFLHPIPTGDDNWITKIT